MAPRQVDVTIKGKNETGPAFRGVEANAKGLQGSIASLLNPVNLLKGAIAGLGLATLVNFFKSSIASAGEAEAAWTRATSALANAGVEASIVRPEIEAMAVAIQKSTRFSDDAATDSFATLVGISKDYAESLKNVSLAANIAAAKKIDLADASKLVGKAMVGETGALARYGIVLDKNSDAITELRSRFAGFAEADGATLQGRLHQIANAWDNVLEATGRAITGTSKTSDSANVLADTLNKLGEWVDQNSGAIKEFIDDVVELTTELGHLAVKLGKLLTLGGGVPFRRGLWQPDKLIGALVMSDAEKARYNAGSVDAAPNAAADAAVRAANLRRDAEGKAAIAAETARNAAEVAREKAKRDAAAAAAEHKKYIEQLQKEVEELAKGAELGTLKLSDLRKALEIQEKMLSLASDPRASLGDRNVAAAAAQRLQGVNPFGAAPSLTGPATLAPAGAMANVGGMPGLVPPAIIDPAISFTEDLAEGFHNATSAIFGTVDAIHTLGGDIGDVAAGAIVNFADAWGSAAEDIGSGALSVGQAIAKSARFAVAASASAKGNETLLDAGKAFGLGLGGDFKQFAAAAKLFAVGTGYKLLAGVLGGGGGAGSSSGGGGGLSASGFSQSAKATENLGTVTVVLNGKRAVIDAADPDDQDGFIAMIQKIAGNRQVNFLINPNGGS